jgi:hypothetical protein
MCTTNISISTYDIIIHTVYVAHEGGDMCHVDVIMVMWQHQRLSCVTHFWVFQVDLWTNEKVPRASPYIHVVDHTVTW